MGRLLILISLLLAAGCSAKTDTGYEPRKLGDSATVQRGYYAAPFSPEARRAEFEAQNNNANGIDRRPAGGLR